MTLRVAALQHDIAWEDRATTLARLAPMVADAVGTGARLVVLPEMFAVGFSMRTDRTAEPVDGPTSTWLADQAVAHGAWLAGSVPEQAEGDDRPRNVLVLAGPDGRRVRYAKRHPFSYGGEHEHFASGDDLVTVDVEGVRVSLAVCYDLRFADQFWAQGPTTDCFLVVANWPAKRTAHWRALLVARAIENQAYVVGVNRVGTAGDGTQHTGHSCIVDPLGELVADATGPDVEVTLLADVDPEVVVATRARFPFLADRRGTS
jgi:predicted amidohydrolase